MQQQIKELSEENESLLAQRKTISKSKESVTKDLEKLMKEFDIQKADYQANLDRLTQANHRIVEQSN